MTGQLPEEWREALEALRLDEAQASEYAWLRARVRQQIERQRRIRRVWAAAAVAAVLVLAVLTPPRAGEEREAVEIVPVARPALPAPRPAGKGIVARARAEARPKPRLEPMRIEMTTDDPDVVIILLVGEEGGSE